MAVRAFLKLSRKSLLDWILKWIMVKTFLLNSFNVPDTDDVSKLTVVVLSVPLGIRISCR